MRGEQRHLQKHFNKQHEGQEPQWLRYNEWPDQCCYDNFDDYLADPSVILELRPDARCNQLGRPLQLKARKASQADLQAPIDQIQNNKRLKVEELEQPEQLKLPPMEMVSRSLESLSQFDKQMDVIQQPFNIQHLANQQALNQTLIKYHDFQDQNILIENGGDNHIIQRQQMLVQPKNLMSLLNINEMDQIKEDVQSSEKQSQFITYQYSQNHEKFMLHLDSHETARRNREESPFEKKSIDRIEEFSDQIKIMDEVDRDSSQKYTRRDRCRINQQTYRDKNKNEKLIKLLNQERELVQSLQEENKQLQKTARRVDMLTKTNDILETAIEKVQREKHEQFQEYEDRILTLEDMLEMYSKGDEDYSSKWIAQIKLEAEREDKKKKVSAAKQIKTKIENKIIKLVEEKRQQKLDYSSLDKEHNYLKQEHGKLNIQFAEMKKNRDEEEQMRLKFEDHANQLENDLQEVHRHILVKQCTKCSWHSKAKSLSDQMMKYVKSWRVQYQKCDKLTDKLATTRELKEEVNRKDQEIQRLQHIIDTMEEKEAKKRDGLEVEIFQQGNKINQLKYDLESEREKYDLLKMQVESVLKNNLEEFEDVPKNLSITQTLQRLTQHQGKEIEKIFKQENQETVASNLSKNQQSTLLNILSQQKVTQIEKEDDDNQIQDTLLDEPFEGDAVQLHDFLLDVKGEDPLMTCIGDDATNLITKDWLDQALFKLNFQFKNIGGKVIEVMAGIGRNYDVLNKRFSSIEMLDGAKGMIDRIKYPVMKHHSYIEKFDWRPQTYDCIVGVFALCYLNGLTLEETLNQMRLSLVELGYMVFMEPVDNSLKPDEEKDFIYKEQKMKIRSMDYYTNLLNNNSLKCTRTTLHKKREDLVNDLAVFIIKEQSFLS